jgi:guanylate kinase
MQFSFPEQEPAILLIVSGPAGCGKTTLCDRLMGSHPDLQRAVTCTTRSPRPGEVDGQDYYFFSESRFDEAVAGDEFLEFAQVHGYRYGTLRREVQEKLSREISIILNIDVQGAATLRQRAAADPLLKGRVVSVFVLPPSLEVLRERMHGRGTDDATAIHQRLRNAEEEMKQWPNYDYCIRSGSKDDDFRQFQSIWVAEHRRVSRLLQVPQKKEQVD